MPTFNRQYALPAATPVTVVVPINSSTAWSGVVVNGGANPVTAATIARQPLGAPAGDLGPAVAFPAGIPLAAGASLDFYSSGEKLGGVVLTLTSLLGTTVTVQVNT